MIILLKIHLLLHDYLIFHQQNIAHDRKCVQYYSVRRAVIPFTDCDLDISSGWLFKQVFMAIWPKPYTRSLTKFTWIQIIWVLASCQGNLMNKSSFSCNTRSVRPKCLELRSEQLAFFIYVNNWKHLCSCHYFLMSGGVRHYCCHYAVCIKNATF